MYSKRFNRMGPAGPYRPNNATSYYGKTLVSKTTWAEFSTLEVAACRNTKGGRITVLLTSCLTGLDWYVLQIKTKIVSCHTDDSKPV